MSPSVEPRCFELSYVVYSCSKPRLVVAQIRLQTSAAMVTMILTVLLICRAQLGWATVNYDWEFHMMGDGAEQMDCTHFGLDICLPHWSTGSIKVRDHSQLLDGHWIRENCGRTLILFAAISPAAIAVARFARCCCCCFT